MNLKLGTKILASMSAILFLVVIIATFSIIKMENMHNNIKKYHSENNSLTKSIEEILISQIKLIVIYDDDKKQSAIDSRSNNKSLQQGFEEQSIQILQKLETTKKYAEISVRKSNLMNDKDKYVIILNQFRNLVQEYNIYRKYAVRVFELVEQGNIEDAKIFTKEVAKKEIEIENYLNQILVSAENISKDSIAEILRTEKKSVIAVSILSIAVLILGFVLSFYMIHEITNPLNRSIDIANKITDGDYTVQIDVNKKDELGILLASLKNMRDKLKTKTENISGVMQDLQNEKENVEERVEQAVKDLEIQKNYLECSVDNILEEMEKFATGDLTANLPVEDDGAIGRLNVGFNQSVANIREILHQVTNSVESLSNAAAQISSSIEELAAGAQEQSAQTNGVASSVEEMTKTIIENAMNATSTAEMATQEKESADRGWRVVEETVKGMECISDVVNKSAETVLTLGQSGDQIGEIIQVIDDIADQTNLLALNATIEAARAGEQGRGFAVVADEVRKLAERTSKATKEITAMIEKIQIDTKNAIESMNKGTKEVENGIRLASQAGTVLKEIVSNSDAVKDKVSQIAAASEQQSITSEEISKNVEAISTVTDQSANALQEIARTVEDMNILTDKVKGLVDNFKQSNNGDDQANNINPDLTKNDSILKSKLNETISNN